MAKKSNSSYSINFNTIRFILNSAMGIILIAALSCCNRQQKPNQTETVSHTTATTYNENDNDFHLENGLIIPGNGRPAIIDFYADWCPPCRQLKPIFSKLEKEYIGKVDFISINVDDNPQIASMYVGRGIPTLAYILKDGTIAATTEGLLSEADLRANIDKLIEIDSRE